MYMHTFIYASKRFKAYIFFCNSSVCVCLFCVYIELLARYNCYTNDRDTVPQQEQLQGQLLRGEKGSYQALRSVHYKSPRNNRLSSAGC